MVDAAQTGFIAASGYGALPAGYQFPHGLFKVRLTSGPPGTAATVTLTFPSPLPTGTVYWKYGSTLSNLTPHWYIYPGAVLSGSTVTLSPTDGAVSDTDLLQNTAKKKSPTALTVCRISRAGAPAQDQGRGEEREKKSGSDPNLRHVRSGPN